MDTVLSLVPAVGTGGTLLAVVIYLLRQNAVLTATYRADVVAMDARHQAEREADERRHQADMAQRDKDIADLRTEVTGLKERAEQSTSELEEERRRRWRAEDEAARYRRLAEAAHPGGDPP